MPRILITCPATGALVPAGVVLDARAFDALAGADTFLAPPCPHCGQRHPWTKAEASLEAEADPEAVTRFVRLPPRAGGPGEP